MNSPEATGLDAIRAGWSVGKRPHLRELIQGCRFRRATEPRDKFYALLGLVGDTMNTLSIQELGAGFTP